MMIRNILTISFLFVAQIILSQNVKTENKVIDYPNGRAIFSYCSSVPEIEFNEDLEYYWFNEYSGVSSTKGGAGGYLLHGKYQAFGKDGKLISESNFRLGIMHGDQKEWNEEGDMVGIYKYENGEKIYEKFKSNEEDIYVEWNGGALVEGSVKKIYSLNGTLIQQEIQLEGLKRKITDYYHDGQIKGEYTTDYVDRMYDSFREYYSNGNLKVQGQFELNSKTGEWKWFNLDGSLKATELYRTTVLKYPDGTEKAKGGEFYDEKNKEWVKNGKWFFYSEKEELESVKNYELGEEVE